MYLSQLKKRNFEGVDACLATSLYEYGIIWKEYKRATKRGNLPGEYLFYYGVEIDSKGEYISFDHTWINPVNLYSDIDWMNKDDWKSLLSFTGLSRDEFDNMPFHQKIVDLVRYWGFENIVGSSYYPLKITTKHFQGVK